MEIDLSLAAALISVLVIAVHHFTGGPILEQSFMQTTNPQKQAR